MSKSISVPAQEQAQSCRPQNATFNKSIEYIADLYRKNPAYTRVYGAILRCAGDKDRCHPRAKTLANMARCSERTVRSATHKMSEDGILQIVKVIKDHWQQTNWYVLQPLPCESYKKASVDNSKPTPCNGCTPPCNGCSPSSKKHLLKTNITPPTPHISAPTAQGWEGKILKAKFGKGVSQDEIDGKPVIEDLGYMPKERKPKTDYKAIAREKYGHTPKGGAALGILTDLPLKQWDVVANFKGTPLELYELADMIKAKEMNNELKSPGAFAHTVLKNATPTGSGWEKGDTSPFIALPAPDRSCGCRMGFVIAHARRRACLDCDRGKAIADSNAEVTERNTARKQLEREWREKWL